jgi:hypothetical protein
MSSLTPSDPDQAIQDEPNGPSDGLPSLLDREVPPMIRRAQAAFHRDLPELLRGCPRQWVAYHGDRRVALGRSKRELYQLCLHQGLSANEFIVRSIEPAMPEEIDWDKVRDV